MLYQLSYARERGTKDELVRTLGPSERDISSEAKICARQENLAENWGKIKSLWYNIRMANLPHAAIYGVKPDEQEYLKRRFSELNVPIDASYEENGISPQNLPTDNETVILGTFIDSAVTAAVMDTMPSLKLIVTLSTGFDHIDLAEAAKRGITVCNVP